MTRAQNLPQQPPSLPLPSHLLGERRQLPPLPSLQPLTSQYQAQQHPAFLPERPYTAHGQHPPLAQSPAAQSASGWQPPTQHSHTGPVSSFTHPALFPRKASYQSKNPGTVYEALSPVEYSTHDSLFSEASYHQSPYQAAPVSSYYTQSPASSYQSSTTSSSGAQSGRGSSRNPQFAPGVSPSTIGSAELANEM